MENMRYEYELKISSMAKRIKMLEVIKEEEGGKMSVSNYKLIQIHHRKTAPIQDNT